MLSGNYRPKVEDVYCESNAAGASCHNSGWNALDPSSSHPMGIFDSSDRDVKDVVQGTNMGQFSRESIVLKNCLNVEVNSSETQVAASLQAALVVAIVIVINISIADGGQAERITEDLLQFTQINQSNRQSVYIENAKDCTVNLEDTQVALTLNLLIQVLLALVVELEIL
ncbi:spore coat protein [Bacillus infantis]|uniref:spore coat protein n=1 Tax=Bacillus infantis TaxID=324767 RepID=UPI00215547D5|nr:spore coat protein [Bacillus infantis]MCR6612622.1 spore coat protein [Bacillus infantis]